MINLFYKLGEKVTRRLDNLTLEHAVDKNVGITAIEFVFDNLTLPLDNLSGEFDKIANIPKKFDYRISAPR